MVTVESAEDVKAFANFTVGDAGGAPAATPSSPPPAAPEVAAPQAPVATPAAVSSPVPAAGGRVFASPLARTLAREASVDISILPSQGYASGPNGRVIADDVRAAISAGVKSQPAVAAASAPVAPSVAAVPQPTQPSTTTSVLGGSLQELYTVSKRTVPHYFLSIEVNLSKIQSLRKELGSDGEALSVQDFLIKSAAKAMTKVPEANAAWMDTFVRKYDQVSSTPILRTNSHLLQVDINFLVGAGDKLSAPVLRDVNRLGLSTISKSVRTLPSCCFLLLTTSLGVLLLSFREYHRTFHWNLRHPQLGSLWCERCRPHCAPSPILCPRIGNHCGYRHS